MDRFENNLWSAPAKANQLRLFVLGQLQLRPSRQHPLNRIGDHGTILMAQPNPQAASMGGDLLNIHHLKSSLLGDALHHP